MDAANETRTPPDTNAQRWFKDWGFLGIVTLFCFFTALTYILSQEPAKICPKKTQASILTTDNSTIEQGTTGTGTQTSAKPDLKPIGDETGTAKSAVINASTEKPGKKNDLYRVLFNLFFLLATGASLVWFVYAFTGDPVKRCYQGVQFAYFFVIGSFAILAIPPLIKSQAIGHEPIGIISGCVKDVNAPDGLRCTSSAKEKEKQSPDALTGNNLENPDRPPIKCPECGPEERNQWLINIGGSLTPQSESPRNCCGDSCSMADPECKIGSMNNRAYITGGLIIPLPFVIIALFGGAVSLSRRVPEIQKCVNEEYVSTATEPRLTHGEARERLAFQIMQYVSAPLIAVVAYQVIQPVNNATSAALAFMAGFGSETILLMIRGVVNGIQPRNLTGAPSMGAVGGVVTDAGQPVPDAQVSVINSSISTKTDKDGHYLISSLPIGPQKIAASKANKSGSAVVTIVSAQNTTCDIALSNTSPETAPAPKAAPSSVLVSLEIASDTFDSGSLFLIVDKTPVGIPADGLIKLPLEVGRTHHIVVTGMHNGKNVRGEIELTPTPEDKDKAITLKLT